MNPAVFLHLAGRKRRCDGLLWRLTILGGLVLFFGGGRGRVLDVHRDGKCFEVKGIQRLLNGHGLFLRHVLNDGHLAQRVGNVQQVLVEHVQDA